MNDDQVYRGRESIIFQKDVLQFRCTKCDARVTWSRRRTLMKGGSKCDCLIERRNCQDRMMAARCPHCRQIYARHMVRAQCVANEALERVASDDLPTVKDSLTDDGGRR